MRIILLIFLFFCTTLYAEIVPAKNAKLQRIEWTASPGMKERFKSYFQEQVGKPWDILAFKIKVDQIGKELFLSGYFSSAIKTEFAGTESEIVAKVIIEAKDRINFHFEGNTLFTYQQLRSKLLDKIKNDFGKIDRGGLGNFINDVYEEAGFYNTSVQSYQNEGKDSEGVSVRNYFFRIDEGEKLKVSSLVYRGNLVLSTAELEEIFKKNATTLASAGFYDKAFFENYTDIIKKEYLARGFVFAEISKARIVSNDEDDSLTIEYGIAEKQQVILKTISLNLINKDLQASVKKLLINQEGSPLNVVELENDLKKLIVYFQGEGYYFANISNLTSDSLIVYDKSFSYAELQPEIVLDRQVCFNEAVVNGNVKTLTEVILRELEIAKGDLITPAKLETFRQKLSNLGLFSSLRISPYMMYEGDDKTCAKTNLVIQVKEKDFGLAEIAPGYRTDLGAKLSTGVTYNNLMGMNRSLSFKAQTNLRSNLDGFAERRRKEDKSLLEYSTNASFLEPYLFHNFLKTQIEFELSTSYQKKRLSDFDADIFRISPQVTKAFKKSLSTSVRYQFERVRQYDGATKVNNDNYSIGGITPSVTLDFRDDPINPKKGAYFTLSSEWANPYFGSIKSDDLIVNYIKVISRNKFYVPMGNFTLAFSLALGYEKNFSNDILIDSTTGQPKLNGNGLPRTSGYIPGIKVFRLDGYDEIRGYDEGEINRLKSTGVPIGQLFIQDEAYFTAFKFEPRYNLTDSVQIGVFFDAGRVFVNNFDPFDLRTSVGAGLKFLTPVGSLDFDYGFKLQRKTYSFDGARDSAGRFHLSIGFF